MSNISLNERQQAYLVATLFFGPAGIVAVGAALLGVAGWPELVATLGPLVLLVYGRFARAGTFIDRRPWIVWLGAVVLFSIGMTQWHG